MWRIWRVAASQLCQLYHGMLHTGSYQWNNSRGVLNGMVPAWQEGLAARAATAGPSQLVVTAGFDSPYIPTNLQVGLQERPGCPFISFSVSSLFSPLSC